ncbi:MAG: hypothetical protein JNK52_11160 [Zoogloeaceae bacterium]|nr:hypothetical protein [Zoogloeaceae bacterium]
MHPIHDSDALLLLALALASKRKPADLVEIVTAIDLLHGSTPLASKLSGAFVRLAEHGLIDAQADRFALTPAGQATLAGQPAKADTAARLFAIKEKLASVSSTGEPQPTLPGEAAITAALKTFGAARRAAAMSQPKPKAADDAPKRPGQWRNKRGAAPRRG